MIPFETESKLGCLLVKIKTDLVRPHCEAIEKGVIAIIGEKEKAPDFNVLILDFSEVRDIDLYALRSLVAIGKAVRATKRNFAAIQASDLIGKFIVDAGLRTTIPMFESLDKYLAVSVVKTESGITMDMNFVNTFIQSTLKTLSVQCFTEPKAGKPFLKGHGTEVTTDIAGVIGLTSAVFTGSIALCFPEQGFLKIISKMFGEEYKEMNEEVEDTAGELLNIIFGQTKIALNKKGYFIEKALPTVIRGDGLKVRHFSSRPTIVLPFSITDSPGFQIEICLDNGEAAPAHAREGE